jgi:proliferating cell nuclear antigen
MTTLNKSDYKFYIWTSKTPPIKYLTELLRDLLTEGNLECNSEGIRLQAVDPSRVVLVHTKLYGDKFEDYFCPEPIILGLNMEDTFKIIKNMENSDTLKLFVKHENPNMLGIETFCKEENSCDTTYLNLMDLPVNNFQIPPAEFDNVIVMSSNRFQKICRNIYNFSEKIEIECVGSQLIFRGCNLNVRQESKIKPTTNGMKFIQNEKPDEIIQGEYDLKHLVLFSKCSNLSSTIKIHIKNDYPLVLQCDVASIGEIKLCLAPQGEEN